MGAPNVINWNNKSRKRVTARRINSPSPIFATVSKNNRGRKMTRNNVKPLNLSKYGRVGSIRNFPGSKPLRAELVRTPSPSRASNIEEFNIREHKVVLNNLRPYSPSFAERIIIKGKPTLKRNRGRRSLLNNNRQTLKRQPGSRHLLENAYTGINNNVQNYYLN